MERDNLANTILKEVSEEKLISDKVDLRAQILLGIKEVAAQ